MGEEMRKRNGKTKDNFGEGRKNNLEETEFGEGRLSSIFGKSHYIPGDSSETVVNLEVLDNLLGYLMSHPSFVEFVVVLV